MKTCSRRRSVPALSLAALTDRRGGRNPAVCTSVDDLKSSVDDVKEIEVDSGSALTDLQSGLAAIESDLADVKADAKSEFAAPLDAVETSLAALQTSVEAATTSASARHAGRGRHGAVHLRHRCPDLDRRRRVDLLIGSGSEAHMQVAKNGWSSRLYWQWILNNVVAFVVVLTAVAVLSWIGADLLHLSLAHRGRVIALLVATAGALLFGGVLGGLQWLVIRQRVPVDRKRWIVASVGPALVGWLFVILPAVISAQDSGANVSGAYLLAASQTLALGPLLGLSQAAVLRDDTSRWAWWIAANIISWLIVDAVFYLLLAVVRPTSTSRATTARSRRYT